MPNSTIQQNNQNELPELFKEGYGPLSQIVMDDPNLSPTAKAIYGGLVVRSQPSTDGNRIAFPSVKLQLERLGLSEPTYYKHRQQLVDWGYIIIKKNRHSKSSEFDNNIYILANNPKPIKSDESCDNTPHSNFFSTEDSDDSANEKAESSDSAVSQVSDVPEKLLHKNEPYSNSFSAKKDLSLDTLLDTTLDTKQELQQHFYEQAFFNNNSKVPEILATILQVFSKNKEQAKEYYSKILTAKRNAEMEMGLRKKGEKIIFETDTELTIGVRDTFVRCMEKIKKEKSIKNPNGYIYKSVKESMCQTIRKRTQPLTNSTNRFNHYGKTETRPGWMDSRKNPMMSVPQDVLTEENETDIWDRLNNYLQEE